MTDYKKRGKSLLEKGPIIKDRFKKNVNARETMKERLKNMG